MWVLTGSESAFKDKATARSPNSPLYRISSARPRSQLSGIIKNLWNLVETPTNNNYYYIHRNKRMKKRKEKKRSERSEAEEGVKGKGKEKGRKERLKEEE
ncbi:hypothetical protein Phum_PHUM233250 [Pediculus humanus corporis]|uniref:Uncharacterized protein n=1 Tax=Pediculus humanus subsp. corporis TaxID=121224 RepID=E0VIT7_PEDHC|nr:uncharacterized protein Phum_PHUM233250 [Pediculus humanus corporis]EEB13293.1 hypothetical protein Phum_PHUM233250 [Pediculus humanus corporis]